MRSPPVPTTANLDEPIRGKADLLALFKESEKPKSEFRVGAEMEKFGVELATGAPITYEGDRGVLRILDELQAKHGWHAEREKPGGPIVALLRNGASITLEPGAQLELSGAPLNTMHEICAEFREHMREISQISTELGLRWLGLGFHPLAKRSDLRFVPKQRYAIMREYLPTRGGMALDMMLRTSTVQANYDYIDEADAMKKMRVGLKLSPLTTALFANSPWYEGARHGGVTYRGKVWLDVDPDRSGLVPAMWSPDAHYEDYVEWALDVPMFLFKRGGEPMLNTGQTFRAFWKSGFQGHHPTQGDWQTHLNTLFPEVRLKKTIEIRGADAQGPQMACALPALWTGIYYDDVALEAADVLTADWRHDEVSALRSQIWQKGLRSEFRGASLVKLAERVLTIAEGGLERRRFKTPDGTKDERVHLKRLKELVARGMTPAEALLEGMNGDAPADILTRGNLMPTPTP